MMYRDPYRRYRRQMRRTFRGRRGGYPVLFPIPYEPLGLIAAAAFSRWAYRNRSAFLPFGIAAAAFLTAVNLHDHHRAWWAVIAGITGLAVFVLGIPHRILWTIPAGTITSKGLARAWEKCGIDRPAERAYVTTVIAATGGWLAAAVADGPTMKPLPAIAGIATVILGIPWWAHRRRRARVRALRTIQTWPTIAENMGLPGSRIVSIVVALWRALREAGPDGVPAAALVQASGKGRTWVYERLRDYAAAGHVIQTIRGHWRSTNPDSPPPSEDGDT